MTQTILTGVYGASGCGRGIMPLVRSQLHQNDGGLSPIFIDDSPEDVLANGQSVVSFEQFIKTPAERRRVSLAIANSTIREKLAGRCAEVGIESFSVRASNVVVMDAVEIGEGAVLCPFVTLTSNIRIGRHFHANLYSYVEHDCVIGDFVTFAPRVNCNGNVVVEDHAYIGTGAILRQGQPGKPLRIGRSAVVGMGAVVTKDVPPGATVIGNPARLMNKN